MKTITVIFLVLLASVSFAQKKKKPFFSDKEEITQAAVTELDSLMKGPEGELFLFAKENNIRGEYTFDITIKNKGHVSSVFVAGNVGGDIPSQNSLKDKILEHKFFFKTPKNKSFKFQYIFKFNE